MLDKASFLGTVFSVFHSKDFSIQDAHYLEKNFYENSICLAYFMTIFVKASWQESKTFC